MNEIAIQIRPLSAPRPRVYNKRAVMPKKYIIHKEQIKMYCKAFKKLEGNLKATLYFHFKHPKQKKSDWIDNPIGDCDNLAKTVLDALEGVSYENDRQVTELIVKKGYSDCDLVEIKIEGIGK